MASKQWKSLFMLNESWQTLAIKNCNDNYNNLVLLYYYFDSLVATAEPVWPIITISVQCYQCYNVSDVYVQLVILTINAPITPFQKVRARRATALKISKTTSLNVIIKKYVTETGPYWQSLIAGLDFLKKMLFVSTFTLIMLEENIQPLPNC